MSAELSALLSGTAFAAGAMAAIAVAIGKPRGLSVRAAVAAIWGRLPQPKPARAADLRIAGLSTAAYAAQRALSLAGGTVAGAVAALLWTRTVISALAVGALCTAAGWMLPAQGLRDTSRRARNELDQVIRLWIVLAAQQVSAGAEPANAMIQAADAGQRPGWRLLRRQLLAAQNERRHAADGLADLVERYGLTSLSQAVGAFAMAAHRGTRMADAVLAAADNLWRDTLQREREIAERRNQVIVLPATAVALALAAILIYPPFVSLTGGIVATGP